MAAKDGPQLAELVHRSLPFTIHGVKWVPGTARFVVLGSRPRGTGVLQVYDLDGLELQQVAQAEQPHSLQCGSFGASAAADAHLAVGTQAGQLRLLDVARLDAGPLFSVQAHAGNVNALDAFGGQSTGCGPPVIATAGKDGGVRVWDPRQPDVPAAAFLPAAGPPPASSSAAGGAGAGGGGGASDCWCVAVGNSYNQMERCLLAGYQNGDIKMFDLRAARVRWESNVGKGVCGVQFDRRDIAMNKFVVTCLESQLCLFEARTQHPRHGFAAHTQRLAASEGREATLWGVHHLPQNRDVFMVCGGDGSLALHKYQYPDQRAVKDEDGEARGVAGSAEVVCERTISCQPVAAFDWSGDKAGAFVAAAFDQTVRVGMASRVATL